MGRTCTYDAASASAWMVPHDDSVCASGKQLEARVSTIRAEGLDLWIDMRRVGGINGRRGVAVLEWWSWGSEGVGDPKRLVWTVMHGRTMTDSVMQGQCLMRIDMAAFARSGATP